MPPHNHQSFSCATAQFFPDITVTSKLARWRLKSPASRLFTQPFIQAQIKDNIKAPRHWPLWGEFPGEFPSQRTSSAESVFIWWRHHEKIISGVNVHVLNDECDTNKHFDITGASWRQRATYCISGSALFRVMAWFLTALSHYLKQRWLIINEVRWDAPGSKFTGSVQEFNP